MIETSPSTAKLDEALAKAQASIHVAVKDKHNPAFRSSYADLFSIMAACREALSANGIAVTQWLVSRDDGRLGIVTRLALSGEWIQAAWSMPVSKQDAHGYGSAATYARRYALAAAVGVVADEDDDGNAASEKPKDDKKAWAKKQTPSASYEREKAAVSKPPAMSADQKEGWELEITLAESIGLDALRKLNADMSERLTSEQKEVLRPSFKAAERRAKERAAEAIKNGKPANGTASGSAEPPPVVGGEAA